MPSTSAPALALSGLFRRFGDTVAVRGLTLEVAAGEVVCLVGPSGCGKSSLLRLVAGVEVPDRGSIAIDGEVVAGEGRFVEPEARRIGFVFQDYALFPHLSVRENVLFGLCGLARAEAVSRAREMTARVGLERHLDRYPHMLSGGEQQRVALARALAPGPRLLLMDEPFSNLDRGLREKVRTETLALLRGLGTTAIIVTHDPEEALSLGDRVVLMRAGEIVQSGSAYDLYDRPASAYAAEFFTAYNRVPGIVRNGRVETALGAFPARGRFAEGESAVAYVRPSAIDLEAQGGHTMGEIVRRRLMGEIEQISVCVEALAAPLEIRSTRRLPTALRQVGITIAAEKVLVFPES